MAITRKKLLQYQSCSTHNKSSKQSPIPPPSRTATSHGHSNTTKTFTCRQCHKEFLDRSNLLCHQRIHATPSGAPKNVSSGDNSSRTWNKSYACKNEPCSVASHVKREPPTMCTDPDDQTKMGSSRPSLKSSDRRRLLQQRQEFMVTSSSSTVDMTDPGFSRTVFGDRKAFASDSQPNKGQPNVFHRTLRNNWSKLVTDKITVMAFVRALKGHQCHNSNLSIHTCQS